MKLSSRSYGFVAGAWVLSGAVRAQQGQGVDPYAPEYVECPSGLRVRSASSGLSDEEDEWRRRRRDKVVDALGRYLRRADIEDLVVDQFLEELDDDNYPIIGLSISGGGTQSGLGGLGVWQAYDDRYPPAVEARTGGITQLLSYVSGLSGGGALTVSTLAANDFGSLDDLQQAVNYTVDYTTGPTGNQTEYFEGIFENVGAKDESGFPISVVDAFGQFWANYLPQEWQYKNYSEIAGDDTAFSKGEGPMPIIVLAEVVPGESPEIGGFLYPGNNETNGFNLTSYEVTPFEFGSWLGGRVQAFIPTEYLGTAMANGSAANSSECARGFDKFSFVQGSTTNAFTAWFIDDFFGVPIFAKRGLEARQESDTTGLEIPSDQDGNPLVILVNQTAVNFNQTFNDSMWATYQNPFQGYNEAMQDVSELLIVDGSLTGETNPIRPLIIPERKVDFLIVYEASSDGANSWVNGTNLRNTALSASQGNIPFPTIPNVSTMITQNLTKQPTFFGCSATDATPLVLYLPNSPWSAYSNFSFEQSSFTQNQLNATFGNAFDLATYGNGTVDPEWPACLACAVVRGSLRRGRRELPDQCVRCFRRHCWNGLDVDEDVSEGDLDPSLRLEPGVSFREWNETVWNLGVGGGGGSNGNGTGGNSNGTGGGGSGGSGGSGSGSGSGNGGSGDGSGGGGSGGSGDGGSGSGSGSDSGSGSGDGDSGSWSLKSGMPGWAGHAAWVALVVSVLQA